MYLDFNQLLGAWGCNPLSQTSVMEQSIEGCSREGNLMIDYEITYLELKIFHLKNE